MNKEIPAKILCLMGPTASGKTAIALELVKALPCDIVSVDFAMIYRDMNIGTAKPTADILAVAPHRLIDIRDPSERYSAADFCRDAVDQITDILQQGRIPLLVGGTMMYFNALQQGLSPLPQADPLVRAALMDEAEIQGWDAMHARLQIIDPIAATRIHPNDPQRILRALEVYTLTGKSLTVLQTEKAEPLPYDFINIGLMIGESLDDRKILHERIEKRFDDMVTEGFLAEVQQLYDRGDLTLDLPALRSVGYRQAWQYILGNLTETAWRDQSIAATRQLAKRQLTWLRSWKHLNWINSAQNSAVQQILTIFLA